VALPTSHTTWTLASAPQTVQLDLEDTGTDVVVQVSAPLCSDWIGCSPNGALIIDDLHLE
jgi:hypothetical protein